MDSIVMFELPKPIDTILESGQTPELKIVMSDIRKSFNYLLKDPQLTESLFNGICTETALLMIDKHGDNCPKVPCLRVATVANKDFNFWQFVVFYHEGLLQVSMNASSVNNIEDDFRNLIEHRNANYVVYSFGNY